MRPKGLAKTGGRQKGTKNKKYVFLPDMFDAKRLDWRTDLVRMLKRMPEYLRFKYYLELMPYLAAKLDAQPYKPQTPEQSAQNAKDAMALMRQLQNEPRGTRDSNTRVMDAGRIDVQAESPATGD